MSSKTFLTGDLIQPLTFVLTFTCTLTVPYRLHLPFGPLVRSRGDVDNNKASRMHDFVNDVMQ